MISILNPSLAPWLAAAAIPLAIHLLTRRTRKRLDLPTVRFLKSSLAQQSRLYRVRHLVLLALRTAAALAIVLAFLKLTANSALGSGGNEHAAVILLIDSSASMGYEEGGASTFDRARNDALRVLEELHPGDVANVVFCGTQPNPVLSIPGDDLADLERAVRSAKVTEERAEPTAALNAVLDQLSKVKQKSKTLYLFSDFQRTNWANVKFDTAPPETKFVFVRSSPDHTTNAGVTAVRLFPSTPRVGDPITAECDVFNSSDVLRKIPVTLTLADGTRSSDMVTAAPNASATASFALKFDKPAQVECTFSIPADNLTSDNMRKAVIDLRRMPNVTLITDDDADKATNGSFFINRALRPDPSGQSGFRVTVVKPEALNNALLHGSDAVVICNALHVPPVQYQALAKYMTEGGSIIWFLCGSAIGSQVDSLAKQLPPAEPMPISIQGIQDLKGNGKGYVTLTEAHYESSLLRIFKDPAAADLGQIHFNKVCLTSEVAPRAETLLKFEDGAAAAVRSGEGSGNLLLLNMSPNPDWSDLARQDAFVPLLHEFLKGIASKESNVRDYSVGDSASTTIPASASEQGAWAHISCSSPAGACPVTADPVTGAVVIDRSRQSGFYHLFADGKPASTLAVNVSADESDLRGIDPRELETEQTRAHSVLAGAAGVGADVAGLSTGRPLWHVLLLAAMFFLCAEAAVTRMAPKVRGKA